MNLFGYEIKFNRSTEYYRVAAKKALERYYEAAGKGRRVKSLKGVRNTGPNVEISNAIQDLRSRHRHIIRNNGWAKRAVEAVVKHSIGEGIRPAPLGPVEQNKKIKGLWKDWAETTKCDFYGKTNFYGLQEQMMRAVVEGGDAIVLLRKTIPENGELPIKLQLCEGDLIDHTQNGLNEQGVARLGVQYSKEGELLGYWLYNSHPGDIGFYAQGLRQSEFFPKNDVLHVFEVLRIGQARGVPFGVASFMKLSDFSDYEDAQLNKQKVASCFTAFITGSEVPIEVDERGNPINDPIERLEPGIIERLGMGETIEFANPPSVGDYDNYSTRILQGIASAYGITYEMLTMDYSRVNFTSGRMAKIDVTSNFKSWQYNMFVPQFCDPVWDWFMDACIVSGKLNDRFSSDWTAPRIQQLDPVRETRARIEAIGAGLTTLSEVIREDGREPDEFFKEYKDDLERLIKLGIELKSVNTIATTSSKQSESNQSPKEKDNITNEEDVESNKTENSNAKQKDEEDGNDDAGDFVPVKLFGVGGTQAAINLIANKDLTYQQKLSFLIEWFGLTESQAKILLGSKEEHDNKIESQKTTDNET